MGDNGIGVRAALRLAETLALVGAQTDLEGAMEALLRGAIQLLEGDDGMAQVFNPDDPDDREHTLLLRADRDGVVVARSRRSRPVQGSHAEALLRGGPSALVRDFRALDAERYPLYERMASRGLRSSVNVGIRAGGRTIGTLHVNHREPDRYGEGELALAELLANQAGAVIERVRLEAARQAAERALERQALVLREREAETAALRRLDELKKEFFSTLSHELRSPLTVIMGYVHRLRERPETLDAESLRRIAERMGHSADQLSRLIGDMLDFARIERGQVALALGEFDVVPLIRDVVAGLSGEAGGERLRLDLPPAALVKGDHVRTAQVVSNLINNALKYAPEGAVVIRARPSGRTVRVEVEDAGPGIPPDELDRVWEKFFRGAGVEGFSVTKGTGLGLAVVKTLVEAQGGSVGVWSEVGRGARFWFELPAAEERRATA